MTWKFANSAPGTGSRSAVTRASSARAARLSRGDERPGERRHVQPLGHQVNDPSDDDPSRRRCRRRGRSSAAPTRRSLRRACAARCASSASGRTGSGGRPSLRASTRARSPPGPVTRRSSRTTAAGRLHARAPGCTTRDRTHRRRAAALGVPYTSAAGLSWTSTPDVFATPTRRTGSTASTPQPTSSTRLSCRRSPSASSQSASGRRIDQPGSEMDGSRWLLPGQLVVGSVTRAPYTASVSGS